MKVLLSLILIFFSFHSFGLEGSDKIELILPISYSSKPSSNAQNLGSKSEIWFGGLIGKTNIGDILEKSIAPFENDLAPYFKTNELNSLINNLVLEAQVKIIGYHYNEKGLGVLNKLDDKKVKDVYKFFGDTLISKIFDRIIEKNGITDPIRKKVWVDKILSPFDRCSVNANNAMYAAAHCLDALKASLIPNAGLAIVYEMTNANLTPKLTKSQQENFNLKQTSMYSTCLNKSMISSQNVLDCALETMRIGVSNVVHEKADKQINEETSSSAIAKKIKDNVYAKFDQCLLDVKPSDIEINIQFLNCIDRLTINAAVMILPNKISSTKAVKSQFSPVEIDKLISQKTELFKSCLEKLIDKGIKKNGLIDINPCETQITNQTVYDVILKTFDKNARDTYGNNNEEIENANKVGKFALDSCLIDTMLEKERDKCVRQSTITFAKHIASFKISISIPEANTKKDELVKNGITTLSQCLQKNLPTNITTSDETTKKLDDCTNTLTKDLALKIADSEVRSALGNTFSTVVTENIISDLVKKTFAQCIGNKPTPKVIDQCAQDLKVSASDKILGSSIDQFLVDKPGVSNSSLRVQIKNDLMNSLLECLKNNQNKENCTDELQKNADRTIVLAFSKAEVKNQLNANVSPTSILEIESKFAKCTDTSKKDKDLSAHLSECNKSFALEFAQELGLIKLNYLLEKTLGSETFHQQNSAIGEIISEYNLCLKELNQYKMEDNLTDKIGLCTKKLESQALKLVRKNLADWMSSEEKDEKTLQVKNEFALIIPCLSVLIPASPYNDALNSNIESILKPAAIMLAQFIDYSPDDAHKNLQDVIKKLSKDLKETSNTLEAKKNIIDLLYQSGALDQFLKSIVRGRVKDSFAAISDKDLPKNIRESLLKKENFDLIFNSNEGKEIKDFTLNAILKPMLLQDLDLKSPVIATAMDDINSKVVKMLVASPRFGEVILKSGIQAQINNMGGFTKFMAHVLYGKDSLNWEKVRESTLGKVAEDYIRTNILLPKFNGIVIKTDEEKRISLEAEKLVSEAVKKYKAN